MTMIETIFDSFNFSTVSVSLVAVFFAYCVRNFVRRYHEFNAMKRYNIPGPQPKFYTADAHEMIYDNVRYMKRLLDTHGPTVGCFLSGHLHIITTDEELMKRVFITDFKHFSDRKSYFQVSLGVKGEWLHSILNVKGNKWKSIRSILLQAFTKRKLRSFFPLIANSVDTLINIFDEKANKKEIFTVKHRYHALTMEIIGKLALGAEMNTQIDPENDSMTKAANQFLKSAGNGLASFFIKYHDFSWMLIPLLRVLTKFKTIPIQNFLKLQHDLVMARKALGDEKRDDILQALIDGYITPEEAESNKDRTMDDLRLNEEKNDEDMNGNKDKLVEGKKIKLSLDQLIANTGTLLIAGYETTSNVLTSMSWLLVKHQDIQDRIREEISENIQDLNNIKLEDLEKMTYLRAAINESMRLFPPVTFFMNRVANIDYKYKDMIIPKGTTIIGPIHYVHHDPKNWPDPERFDPNRFLEDSKINQFAFMPFGLGPRNCIGMRVGMAEIELVMTKILGNFKLLPPPELNLDKLEIESDLLITTSISDIPIIAQKIQLF